MKITFSRKINGQDLIKGFENTYGSFDNLEKLYKNNLHNLKFYADLDNWEYYKNHPDEYLEEGRTAITENSTLRMGYNCLIDK